MKKDKIITSILALTLTLTGCKNSNSSYNENDYYELYKNTTATTETTPEKTEETSESIISDAKTLNETIETIEETKTTDNNQITEEILNEDELIDILENQEQLIMNEALNGDKSSLKNKLDEYFTLTIGFLFCNQPIKGKTLDELTTSTKIKIISIANNINDTIEVYYPDYKIIIEEKYTDVKEWTLDKFKIASSSIKEKLEEKIGTENYNKLYDTYESTKSKIKDFGKDTIDKISDLKDTGVEKIKNWWENKTND